jgi:hypothetical protein
MLYRKRSGVHDFIAPEGLLRRNVPDTALDLNACQPRSRNLPQVHARSSTRPGKACSSPRLPSQVSNSGATQPRWKHDQKELFFLTTGGKLSAAGLRLAGNGAEIDPPQGLMGIADFPGPDFIYDVARDGQRFPMLQPSDKAVSDRSPLTVVSDWQAGLKN